MIPQLAAFAIVSLVFVYLSRRSLRVPHSHGFYRFLAWECILALILLNSESWFRDPFSVLQIISWMLLIISGYLVVHGTYLLRTAGDPEGKRDDPVIMGFEKTTALVAVGLYRYIRHPLYSSLLFLAWGAFLKDVTPLSGILVLSATAFLIATARSEEVENIRFFGSAYRSYMEQTRMFIPLLF